jgi:Uma2 family endonuclease
MEVMLTQALPFLTPEEYLEIERAAETRSEYLAGAMYAMSGATYDHAFLVGNTHGELRSQLKGKDCAAFATDLKLFVKKHEVITYPDVFVTCPPFRVLDGRKDVMTDATVIIEVLSPSTKNYDKIDKFRYYRALPSFRECLLLSQNEIHAEHHVRQPDGAWLMREYSSASDEIELSSINCRLRLSDLYERVELS